MINTNKKNTTKENISEKEVFNEKIFFSLKNNSEIQFKSNAERLLMQIVEFDPLVTGYQRFEFKMISIQSFNEIETNSGLIIDNAGKRQYIVLSDQLSKSEPMSQQMCEQFQKSEVKPISLTVVRGIDIEKDVKAKNIDFLYQYALLPACREDFLIIEDCMEFAGELSIKQLKRCVKNEAAIYQLMFHHALRADLESVLISDEIMVNASPIINSIIRNLEK